MDHAGSLPSAVSVRFYPERGSELDTKMDLNLCITRPLCSLEVSSVYDCGLQKSSHTTPIRSRVLVEVLGKGMEAAGL